ncbi:MAG: ABC transporter ATP-binding protein [Aureliella sp.]
MDICIENLGRKFGGAWALEGVCFSLQQGVACVLGENGAGKSTLLQIIASRVLPSTGRVLIDGRTLRPNAVSLRRKTMFIDEPQKSANTCVQFLTRLAGDYAFTHAGAEDQFVEAMKHFGVLDFLNKRLMDCSKGERAKILLSGLKAIAPPIWLLDEPFSWGLDAFGIQRFEAAMHGHAADGGCVLFTSQWPQHARELANSTVILHRGRLVKAGVTSEIEFEKLADQVGLAAIQSAFTQTGNAG